MLTPNGVSIFLCIKNPIFRNRLDSSLGSPFGRAVSKADCEGFGVKPIVKRASENFNYLSISSPILYTSPAPTVRMISPGRAMAFSVLSSSLKVS